MFSSTLFKVGSLFHIYRAVYSRLAGHWIILQSLSLATEELGLQMCTASTFTH